MDIAVLGGGSGAHAMAADLALAGHSVRMAELPAFAGPAFDAVRAAGGIELEGTAPMGGAPGFARLAMATTDIAEAIRGVPLIMVVVPAYGHEAFMRILAEQAADDQLVVFHSSYFGSLVFARMLAEAGRSRGPLFGEAASLVYLTRLRAPGRVWIKAAKRVMPFAAMPAGRTPEALDLLAPVYPQFKAADSVFETSLNDASVLVHPVTTLLNLSRIEREGPYQSSFYDLTPGMGRVMDEVDRERGAVQAALGLEPRSLPGMVREMFGIEADDCYAALTSTPGYAAQTTPDGLGHRYITEDVPFGLVPTAALGRAAGLDMSATEALVRIAGAAAGRDFSAAGRGLAAMGLSGMDADAMRRHVR